MKIPVTKEVAQKIDAARRAAMIPTGVRRQIKEEALASQRVIANKIYYSRIRFLFQVDRGILECEPSKRYAFGYQLQQPVSGHESHTATYADTNILEARSTNRGERVEILGLAIRHTPTSDAALASGMDHLISVTLRLDNAAILRLGNPSDVPGAAQATEGRTWIVWPRADEGGDGTEWVPTKKAHASAENQILLGEPIIWTNSGVDSKMDVEFDLTKKAIHKLPDPRPYLSPECCGGNGNGGASAFQGPYLPPQEAGDLGTFVDYVVKLYCHVSSPRSVNE